MCIWGEGVEATFEWPAREDRRRTIGVEPACQTPLFRGPFPPYCCLFLECWTGLNPNGLAPLFSSGQLFFKLVLEKEEKREGLECEGEKKAQRTSPSLPFPSLPSWFSYPVFLLNLGHFWEGLGSSFPSSKGTWIQNGGLGGTPIRGLASQPRCPSTTTSWMDVSNSCKVRQHLQVELSIVYSGCHARLLLFQKLLGCTWSCHRSSTSWIRRRNQK